MSIHFSLSVNEQDYTKSFPVIFKPFKIMDYCYWNNPLNSGVDVTQNGRLAVIVDFRYDLLRISYFR